MGGLVDGSVDLTLLLQLPDLVQAQISLFYPKIADALFADYAFLDEGDFMKENVRKFIEYIMAAAWNRHRKSIGRDAKKIETLKKEAQELFNGES